MEQVSNSFLTIAELALGIAGFSGVILVFGGLPETMHPVDSIRVRLLLSMSLGAMVLAMFPFGMQLFSVDGAWIWRLTCGALVAYCLLMGAVFFRDLRRMTDASRLELLGGRGLGRRVWAVAVGLSSLAVFLAQVVHAAGWLSGLGQAVLFSGLIWLVALAAYLFASLVFDRPAPHPPAA